MANNTAKSVTLKDKNTNEFLYPYTSDSLVKRTNSTYETVQEALDALEAGGAGGGGNQSRAYDSTKNVQGYMVLNPSTSSASVASQLQGKDNCIIEIRDIIDLGGSTLNIPSNCTLRFIGGKITNGTLVLTDTLIDDASQNGDIFKSVALSGTIENEKVILNWFGDSISGSTLIMASEFGKPMCTTSEVTCTLTANKVFKNLHFDGADIVFSAVGKYLVPTSGLRTNGTYTRVDNNVIIENSHLRRLNGEASDFLIYIKPYLYSSSYYTANPNSSRANAVYYENIIINDSTIERLGFYLRHQQHRASGAIYPDQYNLSQVGQFGIGSFVLKNSTFIGAGSSVYKADNPSVSTEAVRMQCFYLCNTPIYKVLDISGNNFENFAVSFNYMDSYNTGYSQTIDGVSVTESSLVSPFRRAILDAECPFSITNNHFNVGEYNLSIEYVSGLVLECGKAYVANNRFENIYNSSTDEGWGTAYDLYASVRDLVFEGNITTNMAGAGRCTMFKSKGVPMGQLGTRIYKGNRYTWTDDWMTSKGYGAQQDDTFKAFDVTWLEMDANNATCEMAYNRIDGGTYVNLTGAFDSNKYKTLDIHDNYIEVKSSVGNYSGLIRCTRGHNNDSDSLVGQYSKWSICRNQIKVNDSENTDVCLIFFREGSKKGIDELVVKDNIFNFKEFFYTPYARSVVKSIVGPNSHTFDSSLEDYIKPQYTLYSGSNTIIHSYGIGLLSNSGVIDTVATAGGYSSGNSREEFRLYDGKNVEYTVTTKPIGSTETTIELFRQSTVFSAFYLIQYNNHNLYVYTNGSGSILVWDSSTGNEVTLGNSVDGLVIDNYLDENDEPTNKLTVSLTASSSKTVYLKQINNFYLDEHTGKIIQGKETVTTNFTVTFNANTTSIGDSASGTAGTVSGSLQSSDLIGYSDLSNSTHALYFNNILTKDGFYKFRKPSQSASMRFTNFAPGVSAPDTEKELSVTSIVTTSGEYKFKAPDPEEYPYVEIAKSGSTFYTYTVYDLHNYIAEVDGAKAGVARRGNSTARPSLTDIYNGFQYYDTTLKKYICWNGSTWVNLDGTALT